MTEQNFITTERLSYVYPAEEENEDTIYALRDVGVQIRRGEYVAVLGHNGSGKSTFAKLLNMMILPTGGRILLDGKDLSSAEITEDDVFSVRQKVGMVFQNPDNQLVATVVEEDVAFGPENLGIPREEIRQRVDKALELVHMTPYAKHAPHKLSGGQKQRIAIAGVISMMPECIILDEATAMLDPSGRKDVLDTVEYLHRMHHMTVILITHYMEEAARADRVIVMNDGYMLMDAAPSEAFSRVSELHSVGLEAPQGTELLALLKKEGYSVPSGCISVEECADALHRLLTEVTAHE